MEQNIMRSTSRLSFKISVFVFLLTFSTEIGFWDPSLPESPPQPYLRGRDDDLDEELPPQFRESLHRTRSPPLDNLSLNDRSVEPSFSSFDHPLEKRSC